MAADPSEVCSALERLPGLLEPAAINALSPCGANAVYTPWVVVWLMVSQRLHGNASLAAAVDELLGAAGDLPPHRRIAEETLSANTAAYSRARTRFDAGAADGIADGVFGSLSGATPPSWQGRRVFIVDGTTSKLPPNDELRRLYPPGSNQHGEGAWPILHGAVAPELASGCAVRPESGAMYGPDAVGEVELALGLLARLPAQSVLMAARNFGVFAFCYPAARAGFDLVTRLSEPRFRSMVRKAKRDGPGRWTLAWRPTPADRKNPPELPADAAVEIVLHECAVEGPGGEARTLWLATTLRADGDRVAALYRRRQDVESDIRDVKVALKMEEFRGRSADMLRKELSLGMGAYNLVVQVRRRAAARAGVEPRRLSFTGVWSLVRTILLNSGGCTADEYAAKFELVLRAAGQRKLPNRPGRHYPRTVIPRGRKFPNRPRVPVEQTAK